MLTHALFVGNKLTLETRPSQKGIDIRQELLKFHSTFYSSNLMGLCVLGRGKPVYTVTLLENTDLFFIFFYLPSLYCVSWIYSVQGWTNHKVIC